MSEGRRRIDPKDVLECLHRMGYCAVSRRQLNEFMEDLTRLMDERCPLEEKENSPMNRSIGSDAGSMNQSHQSEMGNEEESEKSKQSFCKCAPPTTAKKVDSPLCRCSSDDSLVSSVSCEQLSEDSTPSRLTGNKDPTKVPSRPQSSSFIRPWRLHPGASNANGNSAAVKKSDPVSMYHKYKEGWKQQKVPGENNHSQLRWNIREKMLGQDPMPRPISQSSMAEIAKRVQRM